MFTRLSALMILLVMLSSCRSGVMTDPRPKGASQVSITVKSSAFIEGASIPSQYTCDGEGVSPQLEWSGYPEKTESFVIIMDDPDAPSGTFTHWVLYNLPVDVHSLPANVPHVPRLENGACQGINSGGKTGYFGPCPPSGTHHYRFKVFALDTTPGLQPGVRVGDLLKQIDGHVIGQGTLIGVYRRT